MDLDLKNINKDLLKKSFSYFVFSFEDITVTVIYYLKMVHGKAVSDERAKEINTNLQRIGIDEPFDNDMILFEYHYSILFPSSPSPFTFDLRFKSLSHNEKSGIYLNGVFLEKGIKFIPFIQQQVEDYITYYLLPVKKEFQKVDIYE